MGSSPRVWGQVASSKSYCLPFRIIPTRVGTSFSVNFVRSKIEDHPHACGDKFKIFCKLCACCGSSPRVWGQAQYKQCPRCKGRIIPTRVGTSFSVNQRRVKFQDHPHACGDKTHRKKGAVHFLGSSPRVWGQARKDNCGGVTAGIIPTRVGTRATEVSFCFAVKDHPHACGDKSVTSRNGLCERGSSPRVWGQAVHCRYDKQAYRIIPTRVGTRCYAFA